MTESLPPVRAITKGPKSHWFGYYDKLQFDPACRHVLGMEVDFNDRPPESDDIIKIGMVDLEEGDRWIELGESRSWCWQQGCMLQWLPGSETEVIWNDRQGDEFVSHIMDTKTGKKRTLPRPVYTVSPDGRTALSVDFRRINDTRPGYGYTGLPDPNKDVLAPEDSGLWTMDLETGESKLILTIAEIAKIPYPSDDLTDKKHYFNHLLFNTDGTRFEFLHRWVVGESRQTRMFTAAPDGSDLYCINNSGLVSHFIWRDSEHILAWSLHPSHDRKFYLYKDRSDEVEVVGKDVMIQDGHASYMPGGEWVLNDYYPSKTDNRRHVYLYHPATDKKVTLGRFYSSPHLTGEWRCDTHPRSSPDGRLVCIDSSHENDQRQMYLIDVSTITARCTR